jgi:hypothetical protein
VFRAVFGSLRLPPAALGAALVALVAKLLLASTTFGTTDVRSFLYFALRDEATGAVSVYERVKTFNHPPTMLAALRAMHSLAGLTGIPFAFWLRLPAIAADLGSLLLVAAWLHPARGPARTALVLCAAAPVSVLVSGFHGNTDPVMMFLLLLSIALLDRSRPAWLGGAVMGLALGVKIVPLVFWPAIFLWLPDLRQRVEYFGVALLAMIATWSPVLVVAPALVAVRVFGYVTEAGDWGVPRLLSAVALASVRELYREQGRFLLLAAVVALPVWMNRGPRRPALLLQLGVVAFAFLALAPGFGLQYLAWLVPFTVALPLAAGAAFHATSGAFLAAVYTFWCQMPPGSPGDPDWLGPAFWSRGLPWNIAAASRVGTWRGELVLLEVACWLAVVAGLACLLRSAAVARGATRA